MGALAHLESPFVAVEPGSQASASIRVRNTGSVVDQFTFAVLGDAGAWASVTPAALSLFPGAEESATVTFNPPRSSQVRAGPLPFGIHVISKEDPANSVVEEGTLQIAPFADVFAELAPRTSRGSRGATHDLAIDNRGNAPLNTTINAVDSDRLLNFDIKPPGVVAEPGTAAFSKVAVKPLKRFWRGPAQTRPFQVLLDTGGPTPMTVDGTLVQEQILPPWFMRALIAALALIALLVVLWFLLLKPAIESTAQQRTQDMLAQLGVTPPPGGFQPGSGSSGSNGQPTPPTSLPPGVTPPPVAPPLSGGGSATDGRIAFNQPALTVPAGKTLFITDLVFSNPSDSATGRLDFERTGEVLLELHLENFRDLDFHFVTPIVATAGQQVGLVCPDNTCADGTAVYYSGYTR